MGRRAGVSEERLNGVAGVEEDGGAEQRKQRMLACRCHTCFSEENQVHTYMHARIKFHAYSDI
jgi:hypothetical protein